MATGYQGNNGYNKTNSAPVRGNYSARPATGDQAGDQGKSVIIFSTGLFKPDREGVKALASIQVKEDITIPAGSYISVYHNEVKKSPTSPDYRLMVKPGKLKTKVSA